MTLYIRLEKGLDETFEDRPKHRRLLTDTYSLSSQKCRSLNVGCWHVDASFWDEAVARQMHSLNLHSPELEV